MSNTAVSLGTGIAVIGMSCRVADAADVDDYWLKLLQGHDSCREVPKDVFDIDLYSSPDIKNGNSTRVRIGNWLSDARWNFDAPFFGVSEEQALSMDPEQRLSLTVTQEALDMAGYGAKAKQRTLSTPKLASSTSRIGVFFSSTCDDYRENLLPEHVDHRFASSVQRQYLVHRIQECYGFTGPSLVADTVCNSSLVAMDAACTSLRRGECDAAIVGGVNVITQPLPTIGLSTDHFLSETGTCKTFDASADGYSRGEAIGVVVLRRYTDAVQDRDNILSVLMSIGTNHSGESISLTFPHMPAQLALMRSNLTESGFHSSQIVVAEAHGTGTQAGDPCELEAIRTAFVGEERGQDETLFVTTAKANFGHSEASSGICSLIKSILQIHAQTIPPHIGVKTEFNPALKHLTLPPVHIAIDGSSKLKQPPSQNYFASCVNNFGAAGGNTTLLAYGRSAAQKKEMRESEQSQPQLIFVSNITTQAAEAMCQRIATAISSDHKEAHVLLAGVWLEDVSFTTVARRPHSAVRKAFVAETIDDLCNQLKQSSKHWRTVKEDAGTPADNHKYIIALPPGKDEIEEWKVELDNCSTFRRAHHEALLRASGLAVPQLSLSAFAFFYALSAMLIEWGIYVDPTNNGIMTSPGGRLIKGMDDLVQSATQTSSDNIAGEEKETIVSAPLLEPRQPLRLQLLHLLGAAFEAGCDLDWSKIQADLNHTAHVCPLPDRLWNFKRYAVPYSDLGIANPVWGESPIRVLRRSDTAASRLRLGQLVASQISRDGVNAVFSIEDIDVTDIQSVFFWSAHASLQVERLDFTDDRVIRLSKICVRENVPSLKGATLQIIHTEVPGEVTVTLSSGTSTLVEAHAIDEARADQEWETLSTFIQAIRHDKTLQKLTRASLRHVLPSREDSAGARSINIGRNGQFGRLESIRPSEFVEKASCLAEVMVNYALLSPGCKRLQASIESATLPVQEIPSVEADIIATCGSDQSVRAFLCNSVGILGEISFAFTAHSGKSCVKRQHQPVAAQGLVDTGRIESITESSPIQSSILDSAAKIIEAEVGVDVTTPENCQTSFASLGVDSLMSLLLLDRLREVVSIELPRSLFFDFDDWTSLSVFLTGGDQADAKACDTEAAGEGDLRQDLSSKTDIGNKDEGQAGSESASATPLSSMTTPTSASDLMLPCEHIPGTKLSIETVKDIDAAISLIGHLLPLGPSGLVGNITASDVSQIQSHFSKPLPMAVFRPTNRLEDVRSILSGPIHTSAMVRRSSVLGTSKNTSASESQALFLIPDGSGSAAVFNTIPDTNRKVYALNSPYLGDKAAPWKDGVIEIASAYITQIRERQPQGPYIFGGWSYGGIVSYEIARQLLAEGEHVIGVLLLDAPCPQHLPPLPVEILIWGQKQGSAHGQSVPAFPPALLRHFEHSINSLHSYNPPSLQQDLQDRRTFSIEKTDGRLPRAKLFTAAHGVDVDPKLVPNTNVTVEWLFGERHNLGPQGWDRLFGVGKVETCDITGNHFTMMEAQHAGTWWSRVEETVDRWLQQLSSNFARE